MSKREFIKFINDNISNNAIITSADIVCKAGSTSPKSRIGLAIIIGIVGYNIGLKIGDKILEHKRKAEAEKEQAAE